MCAALHPFQDSRHALVVKLGRALHFCGAPAHRLEDVLVAVSKKLKLDGRFFSIPTAFFASFGPGGSEGSHLEPIRRNEIDLTRYCRLDRIVESVLSGSDPEEAAKEINSIENAAPEYGGGCGAWRSSGAYCGACDAAFESESAARSSAEEYIGGAWGCAEQR